MAKFNSGYLRTVDVQKTFFETTVTIKSKEEGSTIKKEEPGYLPGEFAPEKFTTTNNPVVNQGGGDAAGSTASNPLGSTASNPLGSTASNPATTEKSPTLVEDVPGAKGTTGSNTTSADQSKLLGGQK